jgi:hypothetical protein
MAITIPDRHRYSCDTILRALLRAQSVMGGTAQMPADAEDQARARDRRVRESHEFHSKSHEGKKIQFQRSTMNPVHEADAYDRRTEQKQQYDTTRKSKSALLTLLAVANCALYAGLVLSSNTAAEVLALSKAGSLILVLAMVRVLGYGHSYGNRVSIGLICCAIGDMCLELESSGLAALANYQPSLFLVALACDFAGEAALAFAFVSQAQPSLGTAVAPIACAAIFVHALLLPGFPPNLLAPVLAHTIALLSMLVLAYSRMPTGLYPRDSWRSGSAGATLLAASKALFVYDRFVGAVPYAKLATALTYLAAQLLLAVSVHGATPRPLNKALGSVENFAKAQSFRVIEDE